MAKDTKFNAFGKRALLVFVNDSSLSKLSSDKGF